MWKLKKKSNYNQKGITLIALVITIIVLLILAGVSIAMLTGENGILTQAQRAKTETENAKEDELRRLTALEAATNLENTTYEDKNGQTATIPAGFAVSQVEGENTIEDGLVIIDSKGNEFVWIPVTDTYERNTTYPGTNISEAAYTDTDYLPEGIETTNTSESNEEAERTAVVNAGGFYISRYEAGKEINGDTNTLVSKSGATVWNDISQENCKIEGKNFINNENVKSALCSGIQWDMVMAFVDGKIDGNGVDKFLVTEYNAKRHMDLTENSGNNNADKVCNIYDLEGNNSEFVAEKNSYYINFKFIVRGNFYTTALADPASYRNSFDGNANPHVTFRFVLYVM